MAIHLRIAAIILTLFINQCTATDYPLHAAVLSSNLRPVEQLLKTNNPNIRNKKGNTPIHLALLNFDLDCIDLLIKKNVRLDIKNKKYKTALDYAVQPNRYYKNFTPLHKAAKLGKRAIVKRFLDHKVDPDLKDHRGKTLLHYACNTKDTKIAHILLASGADPNCQDDKNETPLNQAVLLRNLELVQLLLAYRANPNIKGKKGCTPLQIEATLLQCGSGNIYSPIIEGLIDNGACFFLKRHSRRPILDSPRAKLPYYALKFQYFNKLNDILHSVISNPLYHLNKNQSLLYWTIHQLWHGLDNLNNEYSKESLISIGIKMLSQNNKVKFHRMLNKAKNNDSRLDIKKIQTYSIIQKKLALLTLTNYDISYAFI